MRIMILNGPNLNMLGVREPHIYGSTTLDAIKASCEEFAAFAGAQLSFHQSNHEGELVTWSQEARDKASGIIVNAGGLTHTSVALLDALLASELPVVEVHLSNIYAREEFRQRSVIAPIARGQVTGLGWRGYIAALRALVAELRGKAWQ